MGTFLTRAVLQRIALLFVISVVAHSVIHLAPGAPSEVDPLNPLMKPEDIAKIRAAFHLDEPLYAQYAYWMRDLATGELKSLKDGQPVLPKIWARFLNSVPLFLCATLIVWTLSFPTGIQAAVKRGSWYDRSTTFVAYTLISVPGFFLSYVLILWIVYSVSFVAFNAYLRATRFIWLISSWVKNSSASGLSRRFWPMYRSIWRCMSCAH